MSAADVRAIAAQVGEIASDVAGVEDRVTDLELAAVDGRAVDGIDRRLSAVERVLANLIHALIDGGFLEAVDDDEDRT